MEERLKPEKNPSRRTEPPPSPENGMLLRNPAKRARHSAVDGEALHKKQKQKVKEEVISVDSDGDSPPTVLPPCFLEPLLAPLKFPATSRALHARIRTPAAKNPYCGGCCELDPHSERGGQDPYDGGWGQDPHSGRGGHDPYGYSHSGRGGHGPYIGDWGQDPHGGSGGDPFGRGRGCYRHSGRGGQDLYDRGWGQDHYVGREGHDPYGRVWGQYPHGRGGYNPYRGCWGYDPYGGWGGHDPYGRDGPGRIGGRGHASDNIYSDFAERFGTRHLSGPPQQSQPSRYGMVGFGRGHMEMTGYMSSWNVDASGYGSSGAHVHTQTQGQHGYSRSTWAFDPPNVPVQPHISNVTEHQHTSNNPNVTKHQHTLNIPEQPQIPNVPKHQHAPNVPEQPQIPNVPKHQHTPNAPEQPQIPNVPKHQHTSNVLEQTPNVPKQPHIPKVPEHQHTCNVPEELHIPNVPKHQHTCNVPEEPHIPNVPEHQHTTNDSQQHISNDPLEDESDEGDYDDPMDEGSLSPPPQNKTLIEPDGDGFYPYDKVMYDIGGIMRNHFPKAWPSFRAVPHNQRDVWFEEFKKRYSWTPGNTKQIRRNFSKKMSHKIRDVMLRARKDNKKPKFMTERNWSKLKEYWDTPEFKRISEKAKASKASDNDGLGPSMHTCGSRPMTECRRRLAIKLRREPTDLELFEYTHTEGGDLSKWIDKKSKKRWEEHKKNWEDYKRRRDQGEQVSEITETEMWIEANVNKEKGYLYGFGSLGGKLKKMCRKTRPPVVPQKESEPDVREIITNLNAEVARFADRNERSERTIRGLYKELNHIKSQVANFMSSQGSGSSRSTRDSRPPDSPPLHVYELSSSDDENPIGKQ